MTTPFVAAPPPRTDRDDVVVLVNAAAQTLIEGGRLPRDGELDVATARLTTEPWPTRHRELVAAGGTGAVTLGATWSTGDDDHHHADPEIELTIGDGNDTSFTINQQQEVQLNDEGYAEVLTLDGEALTMRFKVVRTLTPSDFS